MTLLCAWMLMLKRPEGGQCQKETLSSFLTGRTMSPQTALAGAMASLSYLVNNFKVNFQKLSLDSYFTHEKPFLISIYGTKRHEMSVTISIFSVCPFFPLGF